MEIIGPAIFRPPLGRPQAAPLGIEEEGARRVDGEEQMPRVGGGPVEALPAQAVSGSSSTSIGRPRMSAFICIQASERVPPPTARSRRRDALSGQPLEPQRLFERDALERGVDEPLRGPCSSLPDAGARRGGGAAA